MVGGDGGGTMADRGGGVAVYWNSERREGGGFTGTKNITKIQANRYV
jgi:hypothetical protein